MGAVLRGGLVFELLQWRNRIRDNRARFQTQPHKGLTNQGIVAKNTDNQLWLLHKLPYFLICSLSPPSFAPVSFHLFHHVCLKLSRISKDR